MHNSPIKKLGSDLFACHLSVPSTESIRVLQFTDHHLGKQGFWHQDLVTLQRMKALVDQYRPHLIAVTGDLLTGEKPCGDLLCAFATHFFDSLEIPWLFVFGNHDPEGGMSRDQIAGIFRTSTWCVLGEHPSQHSAEQRYDYRVQLFVKGTAEPVWEIYAFDSGSGKGLMRIQDDQLDWYRQQSLESRQTYRCILPAISLFHIPLRQYQDLLDDSGIAKQGENREPVCYEEDDGRAYEAFLEMGNIRATFCGHDHYNNYWGTHSGGITLAYGHISGEATNWAWPTGGKLITLRQNPYDVDIETVVPEPSEAGGREITGR